MKIKQITGIGNLANHITIIEHIHITSKIPNRNPSPRQCQNIGGDGDLCRVIIQTGNNPDLITVTTWECR